MCDEVILSQKEGALLARFMKEKKIALEDLTEQEKGTLGKLKYKGLITKIVEWEEDLYNEWGRKRKIYWELKEK